MATVSENVMRSTRLQTPDPFLATIASAVAYAGVLALTGHGAQPLQLLVLGLAAAAAYGQSRVGARAVGVLGAVAYLVLELAQGRIGFDHYWMHIAAVLLLAATVAAAAAARHTRAEQLADAAAARLEASDLRAEDEIELLLAGGRIRGAVERELPRSRRHEHEAGLLLIRPDGTQGTSTLRSVAAEIAPLLRTSDVAYRHDPRTLCVLLPETEPAGARAAGERLRLALVAAGAPSVSIGAASFPETGSAEALVDRAEEALERARQLGGNRTVASFLALAGPAAWGLDGTAAVTPSRGSSSTRG